MTKQQQVTQPKTKTKSSEDKKSFADNVKDYFISLKYEWLKLTFPTRKELTQSTIVVFLFTIVLMLVISLYDVLVSFVFNRYLIPTT